VFVQSTSYNRKLIGGTKFLYEVEDWDEGDTKKPTKAKSKKKVKGKTKAKAKKKKALAR
jgi:hypothetical protein